MPSSLENIYNEAIKNKHIDENKLHLSQAMRPNSLVYLKLIL